MVVWGPKCVRVGDSLSQVGPNYKDRQASARPTGLGGRAGPQSLSFVTVVVHLIVSRFFLLKQCYFSVFLILAIIQFTVENLADTDGPKSLL